MRWQPFAVVAGLAAPPLVLAALVWPSGASAGDSDGDGDGDDDAIEAELAPGESAEGTVGGRDSVDYLIIGDGTSPLRIDVAGGGFDSTLTLVDPDSGESLDHNDDTNDLDPQLMVDLADGETVLAQVRSLGGDPGSFVISVSGADGSSEPPIPQPRPAPPGVTAPFMTTIPVG